MPNELATYSPASAVDALKRVQYKGAPVVTFAMVDEVHQRADGTASRNFREHRERFVDGEDFVELTSDEIRRMCAAGAFPERTARGIILTQRGYLKLVKPMNDDLAWHVQGEMIDRYFTVEQIRQRVLSGGAAARDAAQVFKSYLGIAKLIGLDPNQSVLAASTATRKCTGIDPLAELGATHFTAPQQEALLTPTQIGTELGDVSAQKVNHLLLTHGYQDLIAEGWTPTEKGQPFAVWLDTNKRQGSGTPIRQLKWTASIIEALKAEMEAAPAA